MARNYHEISFGEQTETESTYETELGISERRQTPSSEGKYKSGASTVGDTLFNPKDRAFAFTPELVIDEGDGQADDRIRILNTLDKPFRYICALDLYFPNYNNGNPLAGSGAMISPNVILTCAHNLHAHSLKKTINRVTAAPGTGRIKFKTVWGY